MGDKHKSVIVSLILLILYIALLYKPHTIIEFIIYTVLFMVGHSFNFILNRKMFFLEKDVSRYGVK